MEYVYQRKAVFISYMLTGLKNERDNLINALEQYINGIIAAGESWTQGGCNEAEYQELNQMIVTAAGFLCEKWEGLPAPQAFAATTYDLQPAAPQASTATTSDIQPAAGQASTAITSDIQPVQPADETQLKQVLARFAIIEEAMFSCRDNAEAAVEQQSDINQLKALLSELEKKHSPKFRKVKKQILEIKDTQDVNDQRFKRLELQLQGIATAQDRMKHEMEHQAGLVEKLVLLPNQLESVQENVNIFNERMGDCFKETNMLNARVKGMIEKCSDKHEYIKTITDNLADNITTLLRELERRLQKLEADGGRNVINIQKLAEKGQANLRILCQMLTERLTPIEQLRSSLNERARMREDNITKLSQVIQEVAVMSPKLLQLELKSSGASYGFSAERWFAGEATEDTIRQYKIKYSNVGTNFNADTGIFTAPVDGLYVVSISIYLCENEELDVCVRYKPDLNQAATTVCESSAMWKYSTTCSVGVVGMQVGDMLFSRVVQADENDNKKIVYFSCFLLR